MTARDIIIFWNKFEISRLLTMTKNKFIYLIDSNTATPITTLIWQFLNFSKNSHFYVEFHDTIMDNIRFFSFPIPLMRQIQFVPMKMILVVNRVPEMGYFHQNLLKSSQLGPFPLNMKLYVFLGDFTSSIQIFFSIFLSSPKKYLSDRLD